MSPRAILLTAGGFTLLFVLDCLDVLGSVVLAASIVLGLALSLLFLSSALDTPHEGD